jgi:hypothetical protein
MLVSFREPIGAVTTTEMKPLGWKTNSLIRTARAAALREKTTRKKRLTDRARTFRKSGLDGQKNMRRPAAGAFFYLTSPFIGQCYIAPLYVVHFKGGLNSGEAQHRERVGNRSRGDIRRFAFRWLRRSCFSFGFFCDRLHSQCPLSRLRDLRRLACVRRAQSWSRRP